MLTGVNWNDEQKLGSPANREGLIRQLLNHFAGLDLSDANLREGQVDAGSVLGDAYEYLIYQFADDAGKKGGEFYTPREVVRLIVELLEPQERMRICDPTAGSCGMLIYAAQYVQEQGGDIRNLVLHGQERNLGTLAIGKLNLLLHGLRAARLEPGDVIAEPGTGGLGGTAACPTTGSSPIRPSALRTGGTSLRRATPTTASTAIRGHSAQDSAATWPSCCTCWR